MNAVQEAANGLRGRDLNVTADVNLRGSADVHLTCPGSGARRAAASPGTGAGRVDLTLPVIDSKLGPAGEGAATRCSFDTSDVPLPPWREREAEELARDG